MLHCVVAHGQSEEGDNHCCWHCPNRKVCRRMPSLARHQSAVNRCGVKHAGARGIGHRRAKIKQENSRCTSITEDAKAQGTRGRKPEKARDNGGAQREKKTEHKAAARKTARHKRGGGQQTPGSSQRPRGNHKRGESARRAEEREDNKTNSTQRQDPGHPGLETRDSQRQRWGATRKKNGAQSGSEKNSERQKRGRGGAATTREQPTARREPQKRRERTESRGAGGQQNKQHTAPRPRAPGAGNQRKPETTGARNENEKKTEHIAAARKTARH